MTQVKEINRRSKSHNVDTSQAGSVRKHLTSDGEGCGGARDGASNDSTAAGGELSSIDSALQLLPVADWRSENCTRNLSIEQPAEEL